MFIETKNKVKQRIYCLSAKIKRFVVFMSFVLPAYSGSYGTEVQILGCSECPKVKFGIEEIQKTKLDSILVEPASPSGRVA